MLLWWCVSACAMGNEPRPRKAKNSTSMAEREQRVDNNTSLTAPSLSVCAYDSDTCAFFFSFFFFSLACGYAPPHLLMKLWKRKRLKEGWYQQAHSVSSEKGKTALSRVREREWWFV